MLTDKTEEVDDVDEEDEGGEEVDNIKKQWMYKWPARAGKIGYLSTDDVEARLEVNEDCSFTAGKGFKVSYSLLMQRGYYPSDLDKPCQDSYLHVNWFGVQWLCVFDGHGPTGDLCAQYARDNIIPQYIAHDSGSNDMDAVRSALLKVNSDLHESEIDDSNSGTTALCVLIKEKRLLIGNVGDCRCVIVSKVDGKLTAKALTSDQTPHRKDEVSCCVPVLCPYCMVST